MFKIPQNSFYAMLGIICILIIATGIRLVLKIKKPAKDYTELRQRIQSWWLMIGLLFLVLMISRFRYQS